jgi:para-nitrobenzyl esterase
MADFLRSKSAAEIFEAAAWTSGEPESPLLIRDGILIPEQGLEYALDHAPFPIVPLITGSNRDELKLFNVGDPEFTKMVFGVLPRARDRRFYDAVAKHQSAMWRVRSVDDQARRMTSRDQNPVFAYRFDWDEEGTILGSDFSHLFGAAHALELPFIFGGFEFFPTAERLFPESGKESREQLSQIMLSYWAEFAYTGNPGKGRDGKLANWGSWSDAAETGQLMIFDTPESGGARMTSDTLTVQSAYQQLSEQTTDLEQAQRCRVLSAVVEWYPETRDLAKTANISNC